MISLLFSSPDFLSLSLSLFRARDTPSGEMERESERTGLRPTHSYRYSSFPSHETRDRGSTLAKPPSCTGTRPRARGGNTPWPRCCRAESDTSRGHPRQTRAERARPPSTFGGGGGGGDWKPTGSRVGGSSRPPILVHLSSLPSSESAPCSLPTPKAAAGVLEPRSFPPQRRHHHHRGVRVSDHLARTSTDRVGHARSETGARTASHKPRWDRGIGNRSCGGGW